MSAHSPVWFGGKPVYGDTGETVWAYDDGEWRAAIVAPPGLHRKWVPLLFVDQTGKPRRHGRRLLRELRPRNPKEYGRDKPKEEPPAGNGELT